MRQSAQQRFAAMGTAVHVVVVGAEAHQLLVQAVERVFDLEQRWSRFQPTSEISRLNSAAGNPLELSSDTLSLVEHGVAAWQLTGGRFDPTMVLQLEQAGYDRSFEQIVTPAPSGALTAGVGCADVQISRSRSEVKLPAGIGFDPGGIGKGLAADIITGELIEAGALGALVNLGGDLAVRGVPTDGDDWVVSIVEPAVCHETITTLRLGDAGLATSTTAKRRWMTRDGEHHHILNPMTGHSAMDGPVLASVIAGEAWWAEVSATAMLVQSNPPILESSMLMHTNGHIEKFGDFARFAA